MSVAYCSVRGRSLQFVQCFMPFSVVLRSSSFYMVEFTNILTACETARKIIKLRQFFGF